MGKPGLNLDGLKEIAKYVISTKLASNTNLQSRPVSDVTAKASSVVSKVTAAAKDIGKPGSSNQESSLGEVGFLILRNSFPT